MNKEQFQSLVNSIVNSVEFNKLSLIGKHKQYHLEENALVHSMSVFAVAKEIFEDDYEMQLTALLHDIGKIYSSVQHGLDDWTYPNHAKVGAENLSKFIPQIPEYENIKWYIANHIKPLYWRGKNLKEELKALNCPEDCSVIALAKLAICDIKGSISAVSQDELLAFLEQFVQEREFALNYASKYGLEYEVFNLLNQGYTPDEALDEWDCLI